jgi:two-component system chemotaxis response regulator CheB
MMARLRVLVVEDSLTARRRIVEVLEQGSDCEVIGEAVDGRQGIELCQRLRPDVITMDMMLPVMSGLAATEYIMAHCPTPILVVSASSNRGELYKTYEALAAGAVDVIEKPTGDELPGVWEQEFQRALRIVARVRVITHPRARLNGVNSLSSRAPPVRASREPGHISVLGLGASTGGPGALVQVLLGLPADFNLPILIVLHIGTAFAASFAEWMGTQVRQQVVYAAGGELVSTLAGRAVLAPPDRHLMVRDERLVLTDEAERHSCRPSVDVLFDSLAREYAGAAAGCLLTGMGRDGALGLLAMRRAGACTIAQDEASSVVYGMPREAMLLGAADQILPLGEIARNIALFCRSRSKSGVK